MYVYIYTYKKQMLHFFIFKLIYIYYMLLFRIIYTRKCLFDQHIHPWIPSALRTATTIILVIAVFNACNNVKDLKLLPVPDEVISSPHHQDLLICPMQGMVLFLPQFQTLAIH